MDSEGNSHTGHKYFRNSQNKLASEQRKLKHKTIGSNNYKKQQLRIARIHKHISNQRLDDLHKTSAEIANRYDVVCVEDLNLRSVSNKAFGNGKATMDNGYGSFLTKLSYKLEDRGKRLIKVGRYYPSSQRCCTCGYVDPAIKDLSIRWWTCPACGADHNRDVKAAINIKHEGLRIIGLS
jgi:putative transposase